VRDIRKPKESPGRVRYLSDEERIALLEQCKRSRNSYLYTIIVLALTTGGRRGEILNLKWSDIDLSRERVIFRDTKNTDTRSVPLAQSALDVLQIYTAKTKSIQYSKALVFPNRVQTKSILIRSTFENAVRRANIDDFRFHDLRHTFASYLTMNGASLLEIAELLGHKTLAMVKRYAHLCESHTRGVVQRMSQAIFGECR
jgi:integrase